VALLISTLVAVLFILSGTFEKVIAVLAFFFVANYAISFISLFVLRWREPEAARPFRAWGYPWTTAVVLLGSIAFLVGAVASDTRNSIYALLALAASYPVYTMLRRPA
jgi:APA family basic amino acid/polyamine antiporter